MGSNKWVITRRDFLKASGIATLGLCFTSGFVRANIRNSSIKCRFGIVTDPHYANIETRGTRYYRQSIEKMSECVDLMNQERVDFMIELGDLTNGTPSGSTEHLKKIEEIYSKFNGSRYHVLGNHDLDSLSKNQFQSVVENTGINRNATYYSFDRKAIHFIVLDANFTSDGTPYDSGNYHWTDTNIIDEQIDWLTENLEQSSLPTVIFIHQLLDSGDDSKSDYYVNNATEVRKVLEKHTQVLTVFQGHQHIGQHNIINNIHYYTLKAMVEGSGEDNSSYAIVEIFDNRTVSITGYRKADSLVISNK